MSAPVWLEYPPGYLMKLDVEHRKRERFTPKGHLIHGGPRQTSKQRKRRLVLWLRTIGL